MSKKVENEIKCNLNDCFFLNSLKYPFFMGELDKKNNDFNFFKINSSLPKLLGYKEDFFHNKLMLPEEIWYDIKERKIFINNILKKNSLNDYVIRLKTNKNEDFYGSIQIDTINFNNSIIAAGFCKDITVRLKTYEELEKKTYELMEKNKIISDSAVSITREITNYMMPLINHSETSLINVYKGSYSKEQTIEMLNDFLKIAKGVLAFNKKYSDLLNDTEARNTKTEISFNLFNLIKKIVALNSLNLLDKRIDVEYDITPYQVLGKKDDIKIVLMNLIGNAIKFSPIGNNIKIISSDISDDVVRIDILNKGHIPEKKLKKMFTSYKRDINSVYIPGQGIGLCISTNIMKEHGQMLSAENLDNGYLTFYFTIKKAVK